MSARWGNSHAIAYEIATNQNPIIGQIEWYCKNVHSRIAQSLYFSFAGPGYHQLIGVDRPLIPLLNNLLYLWSNCKEHYLVKWQLWAYCKPLGELPDSQNDRWIFLPWNVEKTLLAIWESRTSPAGLQETCQICNYQETFHPLFLQKDFLANWQPWILWHASGEPPDTQKGKESVSCAFWNNIFWPFGSFGPSGSLRESCQTHKVARKSFSLYLCEKQIAHLAGLAVRAASQHQPRGLQDHHSTWSAESYAHCWNSED